MHGLVEGLGVRRLLPLLLPWRSLCRLSLPGAKLAASEERAPSLAKTCSLTVAPGSLTWTLSPTLTSWWFGGQRTGVVTEQCTVRATAWTLNGNRSRAGGDKRTEGSRARVIGEDSQRRVESGPWRWMPFLRAA